VASRRPRSWKSNGCLEVCPWVSACCWEKRVCESSCGVTIYTAQSRSALALMAWSFAPTSYCVVCWTVGGEKAVDSHSRTVGSRREGCIAERMSHAIFRVLANCLTWSRLQVLRLAFCDREGYCWRRQLWQRFSCDGVLRVGSAQEVNRSCRRVLVGGRNLVHQCSARVLRMLCLLPVVNEGWKTGRMLWKCLMRHLTVCESWSYTIYYFGARTKTTDLRSPDREAAVELGARRG